MADYTMKNGEKTMFGYKSLDDLMNTILGLKSVAVNTWLSFIFLFTTFITSYIWDDAQAVYTLLALMIGDWILGVSLSIKASFLLLYKKGSLTMDELNLLGKRRFSSTRFPRIFVAIPISLFMLSISWNLAQSNALYTFLPPFIYGGLTGTYLVSLIENVAEFGLIPKELVVTLKDRLNPVKWFKKE